MKRNNPTACIGCGGPAERDCVDNFGKLYKGCSGGCRLLSLAEIDALLAPLAMLRQSNKKDETRLHREIIGEVAER